MTPEVKAVPLLHCHHGHRFVLDHLIKNVVRVLVIKVLSLHICTTHLFIEIYIPVQNLNKHFFLLFFLFLFLSNVEKFFNGSSFTVYNVATAQDPQNFNTLPCIENLEHFLAMTISYH